MVFCKIISNYSLWSFDTWEYLGIITSSPCILAFRPSSLIISSFIHKREIKCYSCQTNIMIVNDQPLSSLMIDCRTYSKTILMMVNDQMSWLLMIDFHDSWLPTNHLYSWWSLTIFTINKRSLTVFTINRWPLIVFTSVGGRLDHWYRCLIVMTTNNWLLISNFLLEK